MQTFTGTFAGRPESVAKARSWLDEALEAPMHPPVPDEQRATAALLLSELATNAIQHTTTALEGTFTVTAVVWPLLHTLCVEVEDQGAGPGAPRAAAARPDEDTGRGLALVEAFATTWGPLHDRPGVLFFLAWQPDPHISWAASH